MTAPVLRPFQERSIVAIRQHILDGRKRIILCSVTGSGKTVLAAAIIHSARRNFDAKILFIAHRMELIDQAVEQLAKWGVTEVGVIRADDKRSAPLMPVQVASIQTLARRELWFVPNIIFVDECHHAAADSYMKAIFDAFPDSVILGLSATPARADGKALGRVVGGPFDAIEVASTYTDCIADGFIAEPQCFSTPAPPDLSHVHTIAGDYNLEELEEVMLGDTLVGGIVERWKELHDGRRTIVFATGVQHSQAIVAQFHAAGIRAAHLDGTTPLDLRRSILAHLESGELEVVSNCQVLTEGVDLPAAKCIVLARPTKSLVLYLQTVGRALRPWNNIRPRILDHAGNFDRHGAPHEDREWSLDAPPRKISEGKFRVCPACYAYIKSHLKECPHCGHVFVAEIRPAPASVNLPLVERTQAADPKRREFDKLLDEARRKGYKPGYVGAKFKEKYGNWPPWSWSQQAVATFEADAQWQMKLSHNETWRARRRAEDETSTDDKLIAMADEVFRKWDE